MTTAARGPTFSRPCRAPCRTWPSGAATRAAPSSGGLRSYARAERGAHIGEWLEQEGRGAVAVAVWHAGPGPHKHRRRKGKASSATKYARAVAEHGLPLLAAKAANQYHARQRRAGRADPLLAPFLIKPCQNETT